MIWCDFDVRFRWVEWPGDLVIQVRATYIDEVWEKINTGRQRVKKRNRTVVQTNQVGKHRQQGEGHVCGAGKVQEGQVPNLPCDGC